MTRAILTLLFFVATFGSGAKAVALEPAHQFSSRDHLFAIDIDVSRDRNPLSSKPLHLSVAVSTGVSIFDANTGLSAGAEIFAHCHPLVGCFTRFTGCYTILDGFAATFGQGWAIDNGVRFRIAALPVLTFNFDAAVIYEEFSLHNPSAQGIGGCVGMGLEAGSRYIRFIVEADLRLDAVIDSRGHKETFCKQTGCNTVANQRDAEQALGRLHGFVRLGLRFSF